jgi:acetoin utilization deacetylase AcuC-like enzyme
MLKIAFSPVYIQPLPFGHRFPMDKYELLPEQLLYEGIVSDENFFEPVPLDESWILACHEKEYWEKLKTLSLSKSEIRATGFPLTASLIKREVTIAGGSIQAALFAIDHGIAMNIAGGTHHAFADRGEGFCLLNDIVMTANYLIKNNLAQKILVIDLDVHQGNGTAKMCELIAEIFTFSMHGAKNYPARKEHSDLDVELLDGTGDEQYLTILEENLASILARFTPDFIIYQCGVDVLASDKLGRLGLSIEGVKRRDKIVLNLGLALQTPIICCMGGGYSSSIATIIDAHSQVYRIAQELYF